MSKFGALGRGIYALIALITRLSYKVFVNVAFIVSLGISVYTVGDYTRAFVKDKPAGKRIKVLLKMGLCPVNFYQSASKNGSDRSETFDLTAAHRGRDVCRQSMQLANKAAIDDAASVGCNARNVSEQQRVQRPCCTIAAAPNTKQSLFVLCPLRVCVEYHCVV